AQSTVGGGGRYDGLIEQLGGRPTPASGWAAGIERILLAAPDQPVAPPHVDLFVVVADSDASQTAFAVATEARPARPGVQQELTGRSLKGQLKQADRIGARYVALVAAQSLVGLKDMESGEQTEHELQSVIPRILRGNRLR